MHPDTDEQRRGRDADAARRRAARDPRVGAARRHRARSSRTATSRCRWRPAGSWPRGNRTPARSTSGCPRSRRTTSAPSPAASPACPRAGSACRWATSAAASARRRTSPRDEQIVLLASYHLGQAAQVDRRPAREPRRGDVVARGALHGHHGGRRRRQHPRDRAPTTSTKSARTRMAGSAGGHGRGDLHRAVPHPEARVRVAVRVHQHLLACAVPRAVAVRDLLPRAGDRRSRAPARHRPARAAPPQRAASATSSRTPCRSGIPMFDVSPAETLEQAASMIGYDAFRVVAAASSSRRDGSLGHRHRPVHRAAEHDRARTAPSPRTSASSPTAPSTCTSARDRTGKASRPRPRSSSASTSVCRSTTSRCTRATPTRRPYAFGTGGSRSGPILGAAIQGAAQELRSEGAARSPPTCWRPRPTTSTSSTASSSVRGTPTRSRTVAEIAHAAYLEPGSAAAGHGTGARGPAPLHVRPAVRVLERVPHLHGRDRSAHRRRRGCCATSSARTAA